MSDTSLSGKVALVTGGSMGIGRAVALLLASRGSRVVISGRTRSSLEAVRGNSKSIEFVVADMSKSDEVVTLAKHTLEWGQRLDILVNNAGMFRAAPIESTEGPFLDEMLRTNVVGPLMLIRECLDALTASEGSIVNVSSTMGQKAGTGAIAYCTSKAALEHATRCLALELAPRKIRVNCVAPGPTDTDVLARSGFNPEMVATANETLARSVPLGRLGQPEEVADWVVRLAVPGAWMTGRIVGIDGGYSVA